MAIFNLHINQQQTNPVGGENIVSGSLVYLAPDGKWYNTTATDKTKSTTELKLAITNSISEDEIEFISYGEYVYPTGTLVAGAKYYVSVLSGQITTTQYNNSTNVIRYVGTAKDTAVLLFNPDQTYISDYNSKVNDIIIQASNEVDNSHTHLEEDISDLDKYTMNEVDVLTDSLGWKLNVNSVFKSKITNDNTVNFIGGTGVTLSYNAVNNAITINGTSASVPNLQQVTNVGWTTTNSLESAASTVSFSRITNQGFLYLGLTSTMKMDIIAFQGRIHSQVNSTFQNTLQFPENATAAWTQTLPSKSGTIALLSDITTGTGTVTSVGSGNGMNFTTFTTSGTITLGTPSTLTAVTTNALTADSHTHAITGFEPVLGNPSISGYVLSSTTGGVRSWIAPATGGSYTHPAYTTRSITATGASVLSTFTSDTIGSVTEITTRTLTPANIGAESSLGNPIVSGYVLSSTTLGVRSWVALGSGGATNLTTTHAATTVTINSDTGTDAIINGATASLAGVITNDAQTFTGVKTFNNTVVANAFVKPAGTNVQFLMAAGGIVTNGNGISVDATNVKLGTLTSNWDSGSTYTITAADFIGSSDKRLKENIEPLLVKKINSVYKSFNFKTNKQSRVGVIAQELEIEHPELVRTDEQGMKSVSYSDLHSSEIAYLKDKVEQLETMLILLLKQ